MEIWLIGGALVALMVYTSTRIKKRAAEAYARETIDAEEYSFVKPEGFICPVGSLGPESLVLHSAEFGETEATDSMYRAEGSLTVCPDGLRGIRERLSADGVEAEGIGHQCVFAKTELAEGGTARLVFIKGCESADGRGFRFEIRVLKDYAADLGEKAEAMARSFELK